MQPQIESLNHLPSLDPLTSLIVYDFRLTHVSTEFRKWIGKFPHRYGVTSGEKLKEVTSFPRHLAKLSEQAANLSPNSMRIVAVGGGSVGDFAGFFASVYKRGVSLIHIPTTWLAAIDSSHGGKTALNVQGAKNQIGTFYPAERVILVRSILLAQPEARVRDGIGEMVKIAMIDGGPWTQQLRKAKRVDSATLWKFLRPAIRSKLKVVKRDPFEKKGDRQVLNFGHTIGHVLEVLVPLSHGEAVAQGLFFAIEFSRHTGLLSEKQHVLSVEMLGNLGVTRKALRKFRAQQFETLLRADKKKTSRSRVIFLALKKIGRVERVSVEIGDLLSEAKRQGLIT